MEAQALQRAQVKTVLGQLDESFLEAFTEELYTLKHPELFERALTQVREEHEEALQREKERIADDGARYKTVVERDADAWAEREIERATTDLKAELEDRIQDLRAQRNQARQERDDATELLLGLVRQVFGPSPKKVYPYSRGITEVDAYRLNIILAKQGLKLCSQRSFSERMVKTRLDQARWEARAVFYLDTTAPGVSEPNEQEDAGALALPEASADGEASTS